jgi:calcineurin-like phosphoesterase family protein
MKTYVVADTHFNHEQIKTYCDRPANFTQVEIINWQQTVKPEDLIIHVGDVFISKPAGWDAIWPTLPGRKILVRGNHDGRTPSWWMNHGFDFACDAFQLGDVYFTHKPAASLPGHCKVNVHGHLHNIWNGFHNGDQEAETRSIFENRELPEEWHRLFAVEYTDYRPVELQKFLAHPEKYQAIGEETIVRRVALRRIAAAGRRSLDEGLKEAMAEGLRCSEKIMRQYNPTACNCADWGMIGHLSTCPAYEGIGDEE